VALRALRTDAPLTLRLPAVTEASELEPATMRFPERERFEAARDETDRAGATTVP
jgi:hypothetical protein